jgi:hypothetical protein
MVVRKTWTFIVSINRCELNRSIRYAKNATGKIGVIPENYVQALADPPEPNEPPPPLSTFSYNTQQSNSFNREIFNSATNASRSSHQPVVDEHQYMNPEAFNDWLPPPDAVGNSSSSPRNVSSTKRSVRHQKLAIVRFHSCFVLSIIAIEWFESYRF